MGARRLVVLAAILTVWSFGSAPAAAQTTLRYQFKQGDRLRYVLEQKSKMTAMVMDFMAETIMEQSSEINWEVQSVDAAGNARLAVTFGRTKILMKTPEQSVEVDSNDAQAPDDALGKLLHKVVRTFAALEVSATVSPRGEFTEVKGSDKYAKEFKDVPGGEDFVETFSTSGVQRALSQASLVLPNEPVAAGATWSARQDAKTALGKMVVAVNCSYGGATTKDGRALERIDLKPSFSLETKANAQVTIKIKTQEGKGTAWFDNAAGRLLEMVNHTATEMDREQMGVVIPIRSVQSTTIRVVPTK